MDTYQMTLDYLFTFPELQTWPAAQTLLTQVAARKPSHWQLPVVACAAVGGSVNQAIPAMAAIACLHTSILLIDDMLDADPKGEYHHLGQPATANLAAALQAAGLAAMVQSGNEAKITLSILRRLNHMVLTTALGQFWDVQNLQEEAAYWRVVRTKSAPFFASALYVGALLGGASEETSLQIHKLGCLYGEMIQLHDDLHDAMEVPANPDWTLLRSPLPILFAEVVPHPDQARFLQLRHAIRDPAALAEAQTILIRCGAISYVVDEILRRFAQAQTVLAQMSLVDQGKLAGLLDEVVNPVQELLAVAGEVQPGNFLKTILPQIDPGRRVNPNALPSR